MNPSALNAVYSRRWMRRRYEVWFLRMGLADGTGAWWFRYVTMNLRRAGCTAHPVGMPVQVWATWFPRGGSPQSFIRGFPVSGLVMSPPGATPFSFGHGENRIGEDFCMGHLVVDGHEIRWDLRYRSTLAVTVSNKGWIGFSRTPHSDAVFSRAIEFDGRGFRGEPLGYGLQGHNCGYRHRRMWTWTHCYFTNTRENGPATFEALEYEMPLGLRFRKAVLWTCGRLYTFGRFDDARRDRENLRWTFDCRNRRDESRVHICIEGSGPYRHHLPYLRTDCSGTFDVTNNSLACAKLRFDQTGRPPLELSTAGGVVLEMTGI